MRSETLGFFGNARSAPVFSLLTNHRSKWPGYPITLWSKDIANTRPFLFWYSRKNLSNHHKIKKKRRLFKNKLCYSGTTLGLFGSLWWRVGRLLLHNDPWTTRTDPTPSNCRRRICSRASSKLVCTEAAEKDERFWHNYTRSAQIGFLYLSSRCNPIQESQN